jgi:hypothetical protein
MKRIAFILGATIVSLGMMAQGTFEKRLQSNEKIDSLITEVYRLGGKPNISYMYDGKLHKTVSMSCVVMDDQPNKVYEVIRNTCLSLTDEAKECNIWEYHRNGVDSVRYAIAIGEYQNGEGLKTVQRKREVYYQNAPELISFHYNSSLRNNASQRSPKGIGFFRYEYTPDSVYKPKKDFVPLNIEAYTKQLLPILRQEGISSRQFYVYHDSTYSFEGKRADEFVIREQTDEPKLLKSETRGTVYTMHSKTQADEVLDQIRKVTLSFLGEHTGFWFSYYPNMGYGNRQLSELFESTYLTQVPEFYHIYLQYIGEEYNIIIVEGSGDLMIPAEWAIVKSWKNGKVTYDKKAMKTLTPMQAREMNSESAYVIIRKFEPFDEKNSK